MWTEIVRAPNLMVAEMWKELFDGEGVTAFVAPEDEDWVGVSERQPRRIMVPVTKKHVAEEVLRKL